MPEQDDNTQSLRRKRCANGDHVALVHGDEIPIRSIIDGRKVCAYCGERFGDAQSPK